MMKYLLGGCLVCQLLFCSEVIAATHSLGIPSPDKGGSIAYDMNSAGQVAAIILDSNGLQHGIFFDNGKMTELNSLDGNESEAKRINDQGEIVGSTANRNGTWRAFLFDQKNGMQFIGTLGGKNSQGRAINNHGTAVGFADTDNGDWHAFVFNRGEQLHDLGTLGGKISYATGVNLKGQIVGASTLSNGTRHAFLYDSALGMIDLGTLGGQSSSAAAINDVGIIVGTAQTQNGHWHAFTSDGHHMVDLGAVIGHGDSYATGVNNAGHVVGTIQSGDVQKTFVYRDNKVILHHAGKGLSVVNAINNNGQVIGATYRQVVAGTLSQGYTAATMASDSLPFVDRGGSNFVLDIVSAFFVAAMAVIYRKRYLGILLKREPV